MILIHLTTITILVGSMLTAVLHPLFFDFIWEHEPLHSSIEAMGALAALGVASLLIIYQKNPAIRQGRGGYHIWSICAFLSMGVLDALHSTAPPGESFVYLHSIATFAGGFFFCMVWLPERFNALPLVRKLPLKLVLLVLATGVFYRLVPEIHPRMLAADGFTSAANIINLAGGLFFLSSSLFFFKKSFQTKKAEEILFAYLTLFFGCAGLLFNISTLWDADWWLWHLIRLIAYMIALYYSLTILEKSNRFLLESNKETESSHALLTSMIDSIPDLIFYKDNKSVYLGGNNSFSQFVKRDKKYIINKTDYDLFDRDLAEFFRNKDKQMLSSGEAKRNEEWVDYPDGRRVLLDTLKTPFYGPEGNILGLIGISRDITEQKKTEIVRRDQFKGLSLSAGIGQILAQKGPLEETLQFCCELTTNHFEAAFTRIWLMDEAKNILVLQASAGMYTHTDGKHGQMPISAASKIGKIALSKSPHITNNISDDPQVTDQEWVKREKMVSFAGHPLLIEGKVIGVIALFSQKKLSEIVIKALGGIADLIALGVKRKANEFSLIKSEAKFRNLIEDISDWVWELNQDGVYTYSSPKVFDLLGYRPDEVIGKTPFDLMPEDEAARLAALFQEFAATKEAFSGLDNINLHKNGAKVVLESSATPIIDDRGKFCGYRGIDRDITARSNAEEALRHSEKLHREAQKVAHIGHWELDLKTNVLLWSDEQYNIFDIPKEKFGASYKAFLAAVHPDDRAYVDTAYPESVANKTAYDIVHRIVWRDGSIRYINEKCITEYDAEGSPSRSLGTSQDVTDLRELELKKEAAEEQLRQAQKMEAIGTLAGGIAHDFNNILSAIVGYATLAKDEIHDHEVLENYIKEVLKGADRATNLVRQILTFSRKTKEDRLPLQVSLIVKEALKLLRSSIPTTIAIQQNITSEALVLADPTQIHQIVMNLCTNAYHAMRETGGTLSVTLKEVDLDDIEESSQKGLLQDRYLSLTVSDTGTGMDEETRGKIFEPYYTTKELGEGTGLGLAVVHGGVESHNGSIDVYSEPGQGSTFIIYLPLYEGEKGPPLPSLGRKKALIGGNETILLVDDEEPILDLTRIFFEKHGYRVAVFTNAVQALQEFQQQPRKYDLLITDMTMPYMTGAQLAQKILEIRADTPIILCTGHSDQINREKSLAIGIKEYLEKPLNADNYLRTVRKVLDNLRIHGVRILFVDDITFNVTLGQKTLSRLGCNVVGASSGKEALDLLMKDPDNFDMIITDQNMPNMTGIELAKQALAIRPNIPILFVTGDENILDKKQVKSNSFIETISKPLEEGALASMIFRAVIA